MPAQIVVVTDNRSLSLALTGLKYDVVDLRPGELDGWLTDETKPLVLVVVGVEQPADALDIITVATGHHPGTPTLVVSSNAPGWDVIALPAEQVTVLPLPVSRSALVAAARRLIADATRPAPSPLGPAAPPAQPLVEIPALPVEPPAPPAPPRARPPAPPAPPRAKPPAPAVPPRAKPPAPAAPPRVKPPAPAAPPPEHSPSPAPVVAVPAAAVAPPAATKPSPAPPRHMVAARNTDALRERLARRAEPADGLVVSAPARSAFDAA